MVTCAISLPSHEALLRLTSAIVAGKTYGVAKKAKLFGIKVMNKVGMGNKSDILAGLDVSVALYLVQRYNTKLIPQFILEDSQNRTQECPRGFVLNISIGTPLSIVLNEAVRTLVDAGIFVAVAAGNMKKDAGKISPASEETVCTVAALNEEDDQALFSNFGSVVDIYAPGVNVLSAWIGEETSTVRVDTDARATSNSKKPRKVLTVNRNR